MSFTPTKEQLEELGFYKIQDVWIYCIGGFQASNKDEWSINYREFTSIFWIEIIYKRYTEYESIESEYVTGDITIQSLEDLKTLIKLLTPPGA